MKDFESFNPTQPEDLALNEILDFFFLSPLHFPVFPGYPFDRK